MKLAVLGPMGVSDETIKMLAAELIAGPVELKIHPDVGPTADAIIPLARDADVLIIAKLPLPTEVPAACPGLRLVCAGFTGLDEVDVAACRQHGVDVCNVPGYSTQAVAEFTLALMLAVLRKIVSADRIARSGGTFEGLLGRELSGRTVGIVGTGAIGIGVAKLLAGFECPLLCHSRRENPEMAALGAHHSPLDDLLRASDVVSLHLPLVPETTNLIDTRRLGLMQPGAILINTARGGLVDNAALAVALTEGRLAGAGLDTIDARPPLPASHALLRAPNVTITPHMAFATEEALLKRARLAFETVAAWQKGEPRNLRSA